jgi:hypothetical protein
VVVTLSTDEILFEAGSWELLASGANAARAVAESLGGLTNDVIVEGHTDDTPTNTEVTNWELSTNRATAVVRLMIDDGLSPGRVAASGFADTRPRVPNDGSANRALNRRVEILVVMDKTDPGPPPLENPVVTPTPIQIQAIPEELVTNYIFSTTQSEVPAAESAGTGIGAASGAASSGGTPTEAAPSETAGH